MSAWVIAAALSQLLQVGMTTIAQGSSSAIDEARQVVARNVAEWRELWTLHGNPGPLPVVDFSSEMAVAVFLGTRPTGGYAVEVLGYRRDGESVVVEYAERAPDPERLVTQALTAPFHVITMPRHEGAVRFRNVTAGQARPAR